MSNSEPLLQRAVALDDLNTFRLPGRAAGFARISAVEQLAALRRLPEWSQWQRFVLGGGSNVLVQGDFPGLVLQVQLRGRRLLSEDADHWLVEASAGENWHEFVLWTLAQGWAGLENLALIPGTVGAAPVQNIGAYGLEIAERLLRLQAVDLDSGAMLTLENAACGFGYRDSFFKQAGHGRYLITQVTFALPKRWQAVTRYAELTQELEQRHCTEPRAHQIAAAVIALRSRKLPDVAQCGNAGSFFKNPCVDSAKFADLAKRYTDMPHYPQPDGTVKLAAGWLIEQCGWKGKSLGAAGVYAQQALVLINLGGATGQEVLRLAQAIQDSVQAQFGVSLEVEPVML